MVQYVSDLLTLGAFGTVAWKVAFGWYKFRAGRTKRRQQVGPFDALTQALKAAAAKGERPTAEWGRGAVESGHAHVVSGWSTLPAEQRVVLVEDLLQVAALTGQLQHVKAVRQGRLRWKQLSAREQGEVLAALDQLKLDSLGAEVRARAPELARAWLWQVTEVPPLLAEEPLLSEPCNAELALLTKAFDKADKAVKDVLSAERSRHLNTLVQALGPLNTTRSANTLKELKNLITSELSAQLGPAALSAKATELRAALQALCHGEDGALVATPSAHEAALKLEALVDEHAGKAKRAKVAEAQLAARAAEVAHVVQVASLPSHWLPSAPLTLKLALVELVLRELSCPSGAESAKVDEPLAEAARKLVPKLLPPSSSSARDAQVQALLAALTAGAPAAEGEPAGSPADAAKELAGLLVEALKEQLPAPREAPATDDEAVVAKVVRTAFARAVAAATPGGALAAAAAGVAALDRADVVASVLAEAARKANLLRLPALAKVESDSMSQRAASTKEVLEAQASLVQKGSDAAGTSTEQRLALAAAYLKDIVLSGPGAALSAGACRALGLLRAEQDAKPLSAGATAALAHAQQLAASLMLASDLASGLDMGPGLVMLLSRLGAHSAGAEAAAAAVPPAAANGHAKKAAAAAANGNSEPAATGEGEAGTEEEEEEEEPVPPETWAKVQKLTAALLSDGLVLLELSPAESRKLVSLRLAVEGCVAQAAGDAVAFNRHLTALKELSTQLGPIMAALEVKTAASESERKEALAAVKASAVASYRALQELLSLEQSVRTSSLEGLAEVRDMVYGLKPQRSSALLEGALVRLDSVKAKTEDIMASVAALHASEDAVSEVMVMEEQVSRVVAALGVWADWVRLHESLVGVTPASAAHADENANIELPALQDLQALHESDAQFLDLYGVGGLPLPDRDGGDTDDAATAMLSTLTQPGDAAEDEERAQQALMEQVDQYQRAGQKLIVRGQVAVVSLLLLGAGANGELPALQDVGLPSTKPPLQLFAERLLKSELLAAESVLGPTAGIMRPLDWYIVAPPSAAAQVASYLKAHGYFGLQPDQVHIVETAVRRPALSSDLKLVIEGTGKLAMSPPCSGDVWVALQQAGKLSALRARGTRVVEVHALEDNLMARPADPVFIGSFFSQELDAAAKAGDPAALMPAFEAYAALIAGSKAAKAFSQYVPALGTYAFSAAWLRGLERVLKSDPVALYRLAPAMAKTAAGTGIKSAAAAATPSSAVAYRLERTLADWVVSSGVEGARAGVVFVGVEDEFAPAVGTPPIYVPTSTSAAVDGLLLLQTSWVEAAGGQLEDQDEGVVEVAPLVSYAGEGLEPLVAGRTFTESYDLDLQGYMPAQGHKAALPHAALLAPMALAWVVLAAAKVVTHK